MWRPFPSIKNMVSFQRILLSPNGSAVAERIISYSSPGFKRDEGTTPSVCCRHCQLTLQLDCTASSDGGYEDLNSQLHYLTMADTDNKELELRPRFLKLSLTAQCNFISLLHRYLHQIPQTSLEQFVDAIKAHIHNETMDWPAFLISSLEQKMNTSDNHSSGLTELTTALSEESLEKIKLLGSRLQSSSSSVDTLGVPGCMRDKTKLSGVTAVSSVWNPDVYRYDDIKTPSVSFTRDVAQVVEDDLAEGLSPSRKRRMSNDDEDGEQPPLSPPKKRRKLDDKEHSQSTSMLDQGMEVSTEGPSVTDISDDMMEAVGMVWQMWLGGKAAEEDCFHQLITLEQTQFTHVLEQLLSTHQDPLPGDIVPALCANLTSCQADISYHNAVTLLKLTALPTIAGMGAATLQRSLISALSSLIKSLPNQTFDGLLLPLIQDPQFVASEAVCRIVKETMTEEHTNIFWRKLVEVKVNAGGEPYVWTEHTVAVAQALIDKKISLDGSGVEKLTTVLQRSGSHMTKSSKFAHFVKDLCSKYSSAMSPMAATLLDIALSHKSSLKNVLLKAVKKLS